jgi:hypothetical protein
MVNKFGQSISAVIAARELGKGCVLILPQLQDKEAVVSDLIQNILPEISPNLFPDSEGDRWTHSEEYEHPTVLTLRSAQRQARDEADRKIEALEGQIHAEYERFSFLHGILTGTGDRFVDEVKRVLEFIGFTKVVKVDEGQEESKQEDLRIEDRSPTLLLEVKGISGMPTENDTQQVMKYVIRRMKEWHTTEIGGVFLVNHQRNLPALLRNHEAVFTPQQVSDALANGTGLMTTWDLFRLVRGMIRWKWPGRTIQDIFFGKGRLPLVPSHYTLAGVVAHFYTEKSVASIDVGEAGLRLHDTVGFLLPTGFFEETVSSLEIERAPVSEALVGQRAGYKTSLERSDIPLGTPIYVVGKNVR